MDSATATELLEGAEANIRVALGHISQGNLGNAASLLRVAELVIQKARKDLKDTQEDAVAELQTEVAELQSHVANLQSRIGLPWKWGGQTIGARLEKLEGQSGAEEQAPEPAAVDPYIPTPCQRCGGSLAIHYYRGPETEQQGVKVCGPCFGRKDFWYADGVDWRTNQTMFHPDAMQCGCFMWARINPTPEELVCKSHHPDCPMSKADCPQRR